MGVTIHFFSFYSSLSKVPNPLTGNFPFPISHPKLLSPPCHSDILSFSPHTHTHNHTHREGLMVWLEASFSRIGLEVYSQNYSAVLPAVAGPQAASVNGRSVYGVLRAGRASSAESLVFSAPSGEAANTHGLAVMLSLAKYFKSELQLCIKRDREKDENLGQDIIRGRKVSSESDENWSWIEEFGKRWGKQNLGAR